MGATYWIKLYHEILRDPKMGRLPDRTWRRAIELFLLAGEYGQGGALPTTHDIAWQLRIDEDDLLADMQLLLEHGIVTATERGWAVTHFETRQGPATNAQRTNRRRSQQQRDQYCNESATHLQRIVTTSATIRETESDTDTDTDTDTEVEGAPPQLQNAFTVYERAVGTLSPLVSDAILKMTDDFEAHRLTLGAGVPGSDLTGDEWVQNAILVAVDGGATRFGPTYLRKILDRWRVEGYKSAWKGNDSAGGKSTLEQNFDVIQKWAEGDGA